MLPDVVYNFNENKFIQDNLLALLIAIILEAESDILTSTSDVSDVNEGMVSANSLATSILNPGRASFQKIAKTYRDELMKNILLNPKNALLKQYQKLFAMDGVDLIVEDDALDAIVTKARKLGTGARGLRSVMEDAMLDIMFDMHNHKDVGVCRVTKDTVIKGAAPIFEKRKASA